MVRRTALSCQERVETPFPAPPLPPSRATSPPEFLKMGRSTENVPFSNLPRPSGRFPPPRQLRGRAEAEDAQEGKGDVRCCQARAEALCNQEQHAVALHEILQGCQEAP